MVRKVYVILLALALTPFLNGQDPLLVELSGIQGLTPETLYEQAKLTKSYVDSKYADAEIDELHRKMNSYLPYLEIPEENGEKKITLILASGEAYRWNGEKYLFTSRMLLYVEDNKLSKVVLQYDRFNPYGGTFLMERRELINPTPFFANGDEADPNDDLIVVYSEATDAQLNFTEKGRFTFMDIDRHRDRTTLITVYKNYMRKSLKALVTRVQNEATSKRAKMLFMIELE